MKRSSTLSEPVTKRRSLTIDKEGPPVISVTALAGLSGVVRELFGDKVLRQAKQAAMLDIEMIEDQECFIPQQSMTAFLEVVERRSGEPYFGLLVAPHLTLARYGCWGRYVLAADDLGTAMAHAVSTLGYHSTGDRLEIAREGALARFSYSIAERGRPGYVSVACGTAAAMVSLFRSFLSPDWRPRRIELDIPRSRAASRFEETFSCPVVFDAGAVSVCTARHKRSGRRHRDRPRAVIRLRTTVRRDIPEAVIRLRLERRPARKVSRDNHPRSAGMMLATMNPADCQTALLYA